MTSFLSSTGNALQASAKKSQMGGWKCCADRTGATESRADLVTRTRSALARLPKQPPGLTTGEEKEKWKTRQSTRTDRLMVGKPTGSFFSEILFF